jgi:PAS domain S-box-containing protein
MGFQEVGAVQSQFQEKETYTQDLIELLPVGVIIVDAREHKIRDLNSRALRMIGGSREDIIGQVCHGVICPAERGRCPITDLGNTVDQSERVLLTNGATPVPVLKSVFSVCRRGEAVLVESFVDISARKEAERVLLEAKGELERRVAERTSELQEQVRAREEAHARLAEAQQRLIELSRQSGMAEVATGVLHNVGNVLNSVNVSATIVANRIKNSRVSKLVAVSELLRQHAEDLTGFLTQDPKGRLVLPYLKELAEHMQRDRETILQELEQLTEHVGHIKEIVATQQNYAQVSGLVEMASLAALVDDAISFISAGFDRHKIRLERDYEKLPPIAVEKHCVLQIMLNLLRNAKQALKAGDNPDRRIRVRVFRHDQDSVRLTVQDNGVGIPAENLTRIFSHGFTTRRDGHGFGLHSGANNAQHMGGALWAESEGPNRGATFILQLPLRTSDVQAG